jgi:hypothetical protein
MQEIVERLALVFEWYEGMVSPETGRFSRTSTPRRRSAFGSAPTTSPRPPVFANGAASDDTNRTFSGRGASAMPDYEA